MTNLRNSFPEKSEKELNRICKDFYKNITEQIINTISQAGISDKALMRRTRLINTDQVQKEVGSSHVICVTAHYGSWEGASTVSLYMPEQRMVAVYHKLQEKINILAKISAHSIEFPRCMAEML
jgi:KDO2-lipid IV(A) lauroyltransferase